MPPKNPRWIGANWNSQSPPVSAMADGFCGYETDVIRSTPCHRVRSRPRGVVVRIGVASKLSPSCYIRKTCDVINSGQVLHQFSPKSSETMIDIHFPIRCQSFTTDEREDNSLSEDLGRITFLRTDIRRMF